MDTPDLIEERRLRRGDVARILDISERQLDRRRLLKDIPDPDEWDGDRPLWYARTINELLKRRRRKA